MICFFVSGINVNFKMLNEVFQMYEITKENGLQPVKDSVQYQASYYAVAR